MLIEGFTERAFDNLNQTMQMTLGQTEQLLNTSHSNLGGHRNQNKRTLVEATKKRDVIAKSSIESIRQYSSPIPNDRARVMPS